MNIAAPAFNAVEVGNIDAAERVERFETFGDGSRIAATCQWGFQGFVISAFAAHGPHHLPFRNIEYWYDFHRLGPRDLPVSCP